MTTDTEANLNKAIDWLQKTGGAIQDFAFEQAPIYCKEVVAWEFWSSTYHAGIGLAVLALGVFSVKKMIGYIKNDDDDLHGLLFGLSFAGTILAAVIGPVFFFSGMEQAIKAAVSPRLVIVEHLSQLRK